MPGRKWLSRVLLTGSIVLLSVEVSRRDLRGGDDATRASQARGPLAVTRPAADPSAVSDRAVRAALVRGSEFLLAQFQGGEVGPGREVSPAFHQGLNALCVYALLTAGQATQDPRFMPTSETVRRLIEEMKFHPMATDRDRPQSPVVYARSLRAAALAVYALPDDLDSLRDDVQWLVDASVDGAYGYDDRSSRRVIHDDSPPRDGRGTGSRPPAVGTSPGSPARVAPKSPTSPAGPVAKPGGGSPGGWVVRPRPPIVYRPPPVRYRPAPIRIPRVPAGGSFRIPPGSRPPSTPAAKPPAKGGGGGVVIPPPRMPEYPPQELPDKDAGPFVWDNSNSQYGFFGVLCGVDAGIEVPDAYFEEVQGHWLWCQLRTGEWPYRLDRPAGYLAMTCAGIASLSGARDQLQAPAIPRLGHRRDDVDDALGAAFAWLSQGDNAVTVDGPKKVYVGYTLFGVERVGLAGGYKYLGNHEWYPELARKVVSSQSANGSWGKGDGAAADTLIDTAYSVLFLARGRHPVMMNKLQLDPPGRGDHGEWNNRPRDVSNLAAFTSRELERPVQWQVVPLDRDPADWSDAPILYFASHAALKLSEVEVSKLRRFVDAGGMLFTQADDGANAFNVYVDQLARRLYPDRKLEDLPRDHEIYTLQYQIPPAKRPRLRGMTDAAGRLAWVHSPADLAVTWQQRAAKSKREIFELGVNLFAFATGKGDLRHRLEPRALPPTPKAAATLSIARLDIGGLWDPHPGAFDRFGRWFYGETSLGLSPVAVEPAKLVDASAPRLAHLYLPPGVTPGDSDAAALRQFVAAGGVLIVESPGATHPAAVRPRTEARGDQLGSGLGAVFPAAQFEPVTEVHPLVNVSQPGMEKLWPLRVQPYVTKAFREEVPPVRVARVGHGAIIHLPLDVTTGLLGSVRWGVSGYEPGTAQALMKNTVLWSAAR